MLRLAAASAALGVLLVSAMMWLVLHLDREEAERRADALARNLANKVVGPALSVDDPARVQVLDQLLGSHAQDDSIVRIKIWTPDGEILWSDDRRLIGQRYELPPEDRALLGTREASVEVAKLDEPVDELEPARAGTFIEVCAGFFDRAGRPLLFEAYQPTGSVRKYLWYHALGVAGGFLGLLLVVMLPFALSLAQRVDRAQSEQRRLLRHALTASEVERERLARDLHDGVIQDLAGLSYVLSALETQLVRVPEQRTALETARRAGSIVRRDVSALRALSTDLYPPDLAGEGLEGAVADLLDQCELQALETTLHVPEPLELPADTALLAYRIVREALRNVVKHAAASRVDVHLERSDGWLRVQVRDDGRGCPADATSPEGHLGLRLLRDGAAYAGGRVELRPAEGGGTVLAAELPLS